MRLGFRIGVATAAAVLVVIGILALRATHHLQGIWTVLLVAVLLCAVPISRSLSRRILLGGALMLGWTQVLWWLPLNRALDRSGILLALLAAGLTAWAIIARPQGGVLSALLPRTRWTDIAPLGAAVAGVVYTLPFLRSPNDASTLNVLLKSGWDHVAHYAMYAWYAGGGDLTGTFAAMPDGSTVTFDNYPTGYHMTAAALGGLVAGPGTTPGPRSYGIAIALMLIATVVVIAAAIAQLPALRVRPALVLPLAALPVTGYLLGPGTVSFASGFPNFVFACALVGIAGAIAITGARTFSPLTIFALSGLVVATAHSWLLLVPLTSLAFAAVLVPFSRARYRQSRAKVILALAGVLAGVAGVVVALVVSFRVLNGATLAAGGSGGFDATSLIGVCLASAGLAIVGFLRWRERRSRTAWLRAAVVASVPLLALAMLAVIGLQQVRSTGHVSYYFEKLAAATVLVGLVTIPVGAVYAFGAARRRTRVLWWVAAVAATGVVVQAFGYVGPTASSINSAIAPGLHYRADASALMGVSEESMRMIRASDVSRQHGGRTIYLAVLPADPLPRLADQWHLSLGGVWTHATDRPGALLDVAGLASPDARDKLPARVAAMLEAEPSFSVVVAPDLYMEIRDGVPAQYRSRVLTWTL